MTPFGLRLKDELREERSRILNEWFFKWYALRTQGIDVDGFDGRRIQLRGVAFAGNVPEVYWRAVNRYILQQISSVFRRAEDEIKRTNHITEQNIALIVADAASLTTAFCNRIKEDAIETDRRIKGKGAPDSDYTAPEARRRVSYEGEIRQRGEALLRFYKAPSSAKHQWYERWWEKNKGKFGLITLVLAALGLLGKSLGWF